MDSVAKWLDSIFGQRRWLVHIFFWLLVLAFYGILFGRRNNNYAQTLFFIGLLMPVTIGVTYLFNYFLIPRYLLQGRYAIFLLYSFYTLLIALLLEMMVALLTFLVMTQLRMSDMSPASIDIFFLMASLLMVVFLGIAIKMVLHWRQSREDYQKLMRERVEAELRFLKLQLNPHFLFNTLNNLYYLASTKSDKAPQAILQLSEILDYVMQSGKTSFVPLEAELKQVDNYIALEMLRYEDRTQVSKTYAGPTESMQIVPMTMLTLLENAFKHGVMPVADKSWITVKVEVLKNELNINISNSISCNTQGKGIGLENLKSQLNYLYGERQRLRTSTQSNQFIVELNIKP